MGDKLFHFTEKDEIAIHNACRLAEDFMRGYGKGCTPYKTLVRGAVKIRRTIIWRSFYKIHEEFPLITRSMLDSWGLKREKMDDAYDYKAVKLKYQEMQDKMKVSCKGWATQGTLLDYGIPLATICYATQIGLVETRKENGEIEYKYSDVENVMANYTQKLIYDLYLKSKNVKPD